MTTNDTTTDRLNTVVQIENDLGNVYDALPTDSDGYMFYTDIRFGDEIELQIIDEAGVRQRAHVRVSYPETESRYHKFYHGNRPHEPRPSAVEVSGFRGMPAGLARAHAFLLREAADLADAINEAYGKELSRADEVWQAYVRQEEEKERQKQERRNSIKEDVQWMIGQAFRLRRQHYKSTVRGRIDRVTDTHIYTTSERGIPMSIRIDELELLDVKYEGEKQYTRIYKR